LADQIFVVPPDWPQPPAGWLPPAGWQPDPTWPPAPAGWQFWRTPEPPAAEPKPSGVLFGRRKELEAELEALQIFVSGTRAENERLGRENTALRAETQRLGLAVDASNAELRRLLGMDPAVVRAQTAQMVHERDQLQAQTRTVLAELAAARHQLVAVQEMAILRSTASRPARPTSAPVTSTSSATSARSAPRW